jgi:hypothetical protein
MVLEKELTQGEELKVKVHELVLENLIQHLKEDKLRCFEDFQSHEDLPSGIKSSSM